MVVKDAIFGLGIVNLICCVKCNGRLLKKVEWRGWVRCIHGWSSVGVCGVDKGSAENGCGLQRRCVVLYLLLLT